VIWITVWHAHCFITGMLRITINEASKEAAEMILAGRVAGPWVEELDRVWQEAAPRIGSRKLTIDLRDVTYADAAGKNVLLKILSQSGAEMVAGPLQMTDLARELFNRHNQA
jgi:hypothetical protein